MENLIVVATHNGGEHLRRLLAVEPAHPLLIVDTGSTDEATPGLLAEAGARKTGNVRVSRTPYKGYDTGAYLWAYWNYPAKRYLFLQDSVTPKDSTYVEQFQAALPEKGVVAWVGFSMEIWDSAEQRTAVEFLYGRENPRLGIFGPIFYASRDALDTLNERGLLPMPPNHKHAAQGLERGWPILFHRAGIPVRYLVEEFQPDIQSMEGGGYPIFTKRFARRQ